MSRRIRPFRVNHMNVVLEDFDASMAHLRDLFGAEFLLDMPQTEWHAALIAFGGVIIEPFVPHAFLLNARYGPHWLGIEYQADMEEVRETIAACGIRIARDIKVAVHTHPDDCFGVSFEFYDQSFHEREWPLLGRRMLPADYWRDEHPIGLTGLKAFTVAVHDLDAASAFLQRLFATEIAYEARRSGVSAHARGFRVGDAHIELLAPDGEGALSDHLAKHGQGIRSTVYGVRDVKQACDYFTKRGVQPRPAAAADGFALPASATLGVMFEFSA